MMSSTFLAPSGSGGRAVRVLDVGAAAEFDRGASFVVGLLGRLAQNRPHLVFDRTTAFRGAQAQPLFELLVELADSQRCHKTLYI